MTGLRNYEALVKCAEFEEKVPEDKWPLGWAWHEVGVYPGVIGNLLTRGLVEVKYKSNRYTLYKLTEKGKQIAQVGKPEEIEEEIEVPTVPEALFSEIIGYDDLKELLREVLVLDKPIHVLLYGPPSLAKTLFLWEIERLGGELALWIVGSAASKAGLWDLMAEKHPRWLLIDEIEKMNATDMAGLLTILEGGRLVRTKVGRRLDEKLHVCVIAAANRIHKLPAELLSRFALKELRPYDIITFQAVVRGILVLHEGLDEVTATDIAHALTGKTQDVRDAIRVARLATRVGVNRAIELLVANR